MRRARTTGSDDRRQPPSGCPGKSGHLPLVQENKVTVLFLNIRGFVSHHIELQAYLRICGMPSIVGITETLLDASTTTIVLAGYELVSRLDRRIGFPKSGGIALFVRSELVDRLVHVADSEMHERSWHILHSDIGPLLFGLWYRPPCYGEIQSIVDLEDELQKWAFDSIGCVICGDMNVHNKVWLQFSNGMTPEGTELFKTCARKDYSNLFGNQHVINIYWIWCFLI